MAGELAPDGAAGAAQRASWARDAGAPGGRWLAPGAAAPERRPRRGDGKGARARRGGAAWGAAGGGAQPAGAGGAGGETAGCGVSRVADGGVARQRVDVLRVEHVRHQPHAPDSAGERVTPAVAMLVAEMASMSV